MQNTSALYKELLARDNHYFETTVVIGDDGRLINEVGEIVLFGGQAIIIARATADNGFLESDLFSVRTTASMFSENPEVGKAIAAEIDISMINPIGDIPRMGVIVPYVRVCADVPVEATTVVGDLLYNTNATFANDVITFGNDASVVNDYITFSSVTVDKQTSEWLQQGTFFIDTRSVSHNNDGLDVLDLHGYDAMLKAEQTYATTNLDWPAVDTAIVSEIAGMMKVTVDPRTWNIMTGGYTLPLPTNYSLREVLGYISSMYLGSFIINDVGELRLVSLLELPSDTRVLVTEDFNPIVFGSDRIVV